MEDVSEDKNCVDPSQQDRTDLGGTSHEIEIMETKLKTLDDETDYTGDVIEEKALCDFVNQYVKDGL